MWRRSSRVIRLDERQAWREGCRKGLKSGTVDHANGQQKV